MAIIAVPFIAAVIGYAIIDGWDAGAVIALTIASVIGVGIGILMVKIF